MLIKLSLANSTILLFIVINYLENLKILFSNAIILQSLFYIFCFLKTKALVITLAALKETLLTKTYKIFYLKINFKMSSEII